MSDKGMQRREYMKLAALTGGAAAVAGCTGETEETPDGSDDGNTDPDPDTDTDDGADPDVSEIPDVRLETADFVPARQFDNDNYERMHLYRKRRSIEVLLTDPEVNDIVSEWAVGFEAYEVMSNHLDAISIQGPPEVEIEESGFPDGDEAEFDVTAIDRQTVYGLIDRHTDEIVALEITEPTDVSWTETQEPDEMAIGERLLDSDPVQEAFGDLESGQWYPASKSGSSSIGGLGIADLPHGDGGTARLFVKDDGDIKIVSAFLDGTVEGEPEILDVAVMDGPVEYTLDDIAADVSPASESVVDEVPDVPTEQRPFYTANSGYHRLEDPPKEFDQDGWSIEWQEAEYQGCTYAASYNGTPVFEAMNVPMTMTGYYLPPKEDQTSREWYFPDDDSVFSGDLLFWDILGRDGFGGPGMIGKLDFPADRGTPSGFRMKNHYHTGAQDRESQDFHSGFRFGPYNYDFGYDFFADGVLDLVFRRAGPGYITRFTKKIRDNAATYEEDGSYEEPVVQDYTVGHAMNVTPGTDEGVTVELFDGDEWTEPEEGFYVAGEAGMKARFSNPDGEEAVDVPLGDDEELVVVPVDGEQVGPGEASANRYDDGVEEFLYHPAQYVEERPIQGERVIVWILQVGATNEVPYPSGTTNFATTSQIKLSGY